MSRSTSVLFIPFPSIVAKASPCRASEGADGRVDRNDWPKALREWRRPSWFPDSWE